MRANGVGIATLVLAGEATSANDASFGYSADDLIVSATVAGLYQRLDAHSERTCALYGAAEIAWRESCAMDFVDDFVMARDDLIFDESI